MILLKDFAEERGEQANTISTYIRRHPEEFEGHTSLDGRKMLLDEQAVKILEKVYPLPRPVEVIKDFKTIQELADARKEIDELQKVLINNADVVARAEATMILLEDKQKEVDDVKQEMKDVRKDLKDLQQRYDNQKDRIHELEMALAAEKNKSFLQKLFKK